MAKKEVPMEQLRAYLPANTYEAVLAYLQKYKVHLTIAKERDSLLGDYRHRQHSMHHRISVNGNLNKYAFLITLLHELAHLLTFEAFGNRVPAHGKEWKKIYGSILHEFIEHKVFPEDIEAELQKSLHSPAASSCAEEGLQRVLYKYNIQKKDHLLLEQLPTGATFKTKDQRLFKKGKKRTKRYECMELQSGKIYLFSPIYEIQQVKIE